ncbi:hypothetical protein CAPTEDRAFT_209775 [Capitella teleta]|uniref:Aminotransferase class V domain-containing protein n=1 Tax=Capitella teleta TaxID=283909 RepID=R7TQR1_CAPTE|nr:hypothetical protein CAPTEDRAFT_209775 [Capitella teleta]|eukprot:ELT96263.1 hypothetical protein CAPTEDRAFT_209775 [Capitella teleta]
MALKMAENKSSANLTKRDFGSFHASNVEELVSMSEEEYLPPPFPFEQPNFLHFAKHFPVGSEAKKELFFIEEETTFLNHGAFGAVMKASLQVAQKWQVHIEKQPLRFFDRELLPHLAFVTRRLAKFVGCDATDLVLVPNATTATNTVLSSLNLKPGERVFFLSCEYGAVKKNLEKLRDDTGVITQQACVKFPLASQEHLLDLVRSQLLPNTCVAIFDHVPSNCPFVMPIKELTAICHENGTRILVDGAHALGCMTLDLRSLGVDYYTSNAHKWFSAPKGAAFLFVQRDLQKQTRPLIISHGFGSGFSSEFIWSGLRDYSPFLAMHTILDFHEAVGSEKIYQQMLTLTHDAGLHRSFGFFISSIPLTCVQLPDAMYSKYPAVQYSHAECIQNALFHRFNIEVPIKAIDGHLYVRISCHIHNCIEEYQLLAECICTLTEEQYLYVNIPI